MIHHNHEQGSEAWLAARKGCITGSRFKDCRDKLKGGAPSKACIAYAMDTARERAGGSAPAKFQNAAMRTGTEALRADSEALRARGADILVAVAHTERSVDHEIVRSRLVDILLTGHDHDLAITFGND